MTGQLTDRQLEVLALARIATPEQIARRLGLRAGTVHSTLADIRRGLGVATTGEAVRVGLARGWIG